MSGYGDRDRYRDRERDRSRSRSRERGRGYHDRGRDRDYDRPRRVSLLVRNLGFDTRQEDVRRLFDKYGEVKDVYIPMNYHTKEPQGFAFVEFYDERDAEYAKRKLDREMLNGRELTVIFAKQQRKRPDDMRARAQRERSQSPRRRRSRSGSRGRRDADRNRSSTPSPAPRKESGREERAHSPSASPPRREAVEEREEAGTE